MSDPSRALEGRDPNRAWVEAERIAQAFHEAYERQAPSHGYETWPESAVPWEQLPGRQHDLMVDTVHELLVRGVLTAVQQSEGRCGRKPTFEDQEHGRIIPGHREPCGKRIGHSGPCSWGRPPAEFERQQPEGNLQSMPVEWEEMKRRAEMAEAELEQLRAQPEREGEDPYESEKIQMYNLGGEYPDLPTRLLAWPDFCTQVDRANTAEARIGELARKLTEANIDKHTAEGLQRKAAGELTEAIKDREAAKRRAAEAEGENRRMRDTFGTNEDTFAKQLRYDGEKIKQLDALLALRTEALREAQAAIEMYVAGIERDRHAKATIRGAGYTASSSAGGRYVLELIRAATDSPEGDE